MNELLADDIVLSAPDANDRLLNWRHGMLRTSDAAAL